MALSVLLSWSQVSALVWELGLSLLEVTLKPELCSMHLCGWATSSWVQQSFPPNHWRMKIPLKQRGGQQRKCKLERKRLVFLHTSFKRLLTCNQIQWFIYCFCHLFKVWEFRRIVSALRGPFLCLEVGILILLAFLLHLDFWDKVYLCVLFRMHMLWCEMWKKVIKE